MCFMDVSVLPVLALIPDEKKSESMHLLEQAELHLAQIVGELASQMARAWAEEMDEEFATQRRAQWQQVR